VPPGKPGLPCPTTIPPLASIEKVLINFYY
jgi:hypothetical protein